ncbi:unnamed protein product [Gongylonema pulchrum]|uniref:BHLH domain-containing protein n=1 Tax=Gongylonema pulchrum TaxID=637853 RepID=A0A183EQV2_9BILA|nr:unnamed protein product [Gongylonema pulchrum]
MNEDIDPAIAEQRNRKERAESILNYLKNTLRDDDGRTVTRRQKLRRILSVLFHLIRIVDKDEEQYADEEGNPAASQFLVRYHKNGSFEFRYQKW